MNTQEKLPEWKEANDEQRLKYVKAVEYFVGDSLHKEEKYIHDKKRTRIEAITVENYSVKSSLIRGVALIVFALSLLLLVVGFISMLSMDISPSDQDEILLGALMWLVVSIVSLILATHKTSSELKQQDLDDYVRRYREAVSDLR